MTTDVPTDGTVKKFTDKIVSLGVEGVGPFKGAEEIAQEHLEGARGDVEVAIRRMINTHSRIVGASGFAAGLGGIATMPLTIPTDVTVFYSFAARCSAGVARLRGWDVDTDEVRSVVLISLLGAAGGGLIAKYGIEIGNKAAMAALGKLPGAVLIEINKKVGFRLLTKFGEKGAVNLVKVVPVAGGVVGGTVNVMSMRAIGAWSKTNFPSLRAQS